MVTDRGASAGRAVDPQLTASRPCVGACAACGQRVDLAKRAVPADLDRGVVRSRRTRLLVRYFVWER